METLRRLPLDARDRPAQVRSGWPQVIHEAALAYGWEPARAGCEPPSPEAIDRADLMFAALRAIPRPLAEVALARACGVPWRKLVARADKAERTLRYWLVEAWCLIAEFVNS